VVECFAAVAGGSDEDPEIGREAGLADKICEAARAERLLERTFFRLRFGGQDFIAHALTLPYRKRREYVAGRTSRFDRSLDARYSMLDPPTRP
jgi:hypothetical protein